MTVYYTFTIKKDAYSEPVEHYMSREEFVKFAEECIIYDRLDHGLEKYLVKPVEWVEVNGKMVLNRKVNDYEWSVAAMNYFKKDGGEITVKIDLDTYKK